MWDVVKMVLPVRLFARVTKSIKLPGLNGATLYDVCQFFISEISKGDLMQNADVVTFNFVMAIPPTFLFLFSLVPYLPLKNVEPVILKTLRMVTPNSKIYGVAVGIVDDFLHNQHKRAFSFGLLLTLYFASNGMGTLIKCFDESASLYKKRSYLMRKWTSIKLTLMLIGVLFATLTLLIIQNNAVNKYLVKIFHNVVVVKTTGICMLVLLIFVAVSIIYTYGPSLKHRFKFVSAGSVFATIASLILTAVFVSVVNNFLN